MGRGIIPILQATPNLNLGSRASLAVAVASLPTTILGETPAWRYHGGDATATDWPAATFGDTLTLVGSGAAPTLNNGSDFNAPGADDSVKLNAGKYYERSGDNTFGDVSTNDFWMKIILKFVNATTIIQGKFISGGPMWEMLIIVNASGQLSMQIDDGPDAVLQSQVGLTVGAWHAIDIVADKSGSMRFYIDGVQGPADADISAVGDLDSNQPFSVGARSTSGSNPTNCNIAYIACWQAAAWLASHDQDTLVAQHYADLII
ncbi:MAG: LamG-like jellyroll fold domain-containing protein [Dehalococcoidales bacterium]